MVQPQLKAEGAAMLNWSSGDETENTFPASLYFFDQHVHLQLNTVQSHVRCAEAMMVSSR